MKASLWYVTTVPVTERHRERGREREVADIIVCVMKGNEKSQIWKQWRSERVRQPTGEGGPWYFLLVCL